MAQTTRAWSKTFSGVPPSDNRFNRGRLRGGNVRLHACLRVWMLDVVMGFEVGISVLLLKSYQTIFKKQQDQSSKTKKTW